MGASERDEFLRAAWRALVAQGTDAGRFVFVEECSTNTSMSPLYAWSRRGERARWRAPRNWGPNVTLLSSMSTQGIGPSMAVEGSTTREVFEAYLEQALAPALKPGQIVVMDNLSAHKGGRVREIVEGRGCELLYLPPYSPDLDPIEEAFSKIKGLLRKAEARAREALIEAMGEALSAVTGSDAPAATSPTAATVQWVNYGDGRFRARLVEPNLYVVLHRRIFLVLCAARDAVTGGG